MTSLLDMSASSDSEDDFDYIPPTENVAASDSSVDDLISDEEFVSGREPEATQNEQGASNPLTAGQSDQRQRANQLYLSFLYDVGESAPITPNPAVRNGNNASVNSSVASNSQASEVEVKPASKTTENSSVASNSKASEVDAEPASKTTENSSVASNSKASEVDAKTTELSGDTVASNIHCVAKDGSSSASDDPIDVEVEVQSGKKRGIDSVLGTILNKNNKKLTVLDKSKLDWDEFKKTQGLENELVKINKGKAGFLEKKRFLERSDLRSFEIEKSMRQTLRKK